MIALRSNTASSGRPASPPTARPAPVSALQRREGLGTKWFLVIVAAALVLRLAMIPTAGVYHPDELFQYLEQAHRLVFGQGVVPWEYRYGMRSWLLPLLLAGPMALGDALAPATSLYILLPRSLAVLSSLTVVWTAWKLGRRQSEAGGLIAATIAACWAEFVYFSPHILSETLSLDLLLPAAVLLTGQGGARQIVLAGFLVGLAVLLRLQHMPAAVALAILALGFRRDAWTAFIAGGFAALVLGAAVDIAMGQTPFGWAFEYVRQNIILHRSANYGTAYSWAYAQTFGIVFSWWALPMLGLAAIGARHETSLFRVGLVNLAVHMAIGHKEYRFVLLTSSILVLLAAIGTVDLVARTAAYRPRWRRAAPATALLIWACASAWLGWLGRPAQYATLDHRGLALFERLREDPKLCGLASHGMHFSAGGGYTYLHRAVPLYSYAPQEGRLLISEAGRFNRLIAPHFVTPPPGFRRGTCQPGNDEYPTACIFVREGGCAGGRSAAEINRALARVDE